MDNLSGLDCLLSSNSSTHSLMCSSPSIDADMSILIIARTCSTPFVLLFFLILSQPLVSIYQLSSHSSSSSHYPIVFHCSLAIAISVPLSYITLQTPLTLANDLDIVFFCIHSFSFYGPLYRYRTISGTFTHPVSRALCLETPYHSATCSRQVQLRLFGRFTGVVHTTRGSRSASLPRSSTLSPSSPRLVSVCHIQSSAKQSYDPAFFSQPRTVIATIATLTDQADVQPCFRRPRV